MVSVPKSASLFDVSSRGGGGENGLVGLFLSLQGRLHCSFFHLLSLGGGIQFVVCSIVSQFQAHSTELRGSYKIVEGGTLQHLVLHFSNDWRFDDSVSLE